MKVRGTDGKEYTIEPRADLSGTTNLRGANLYRANLMRADLTNANLSGTVWNDGTVFPEGFEIPDELRG